MPENQSNTNNLTNLSVVITGGSGLIGKQLTLLLLREGYRVSHLSRSRRSQDGIRVFMWDPEKNTIDPEALEGADFIIHLAGANIGAKRWSPERKSEILGSRAEASRFLHRKAEEKGLSLKGFISASAIGIYGSQTGNRIFNEDDPAGTGFLESVCKEWEETADLFSKSGVRTVKIRSAIVLDKGDSVLSQMMRPAKFGFLMQTGTGRQYMPWIHIDDLCNIYLKSIQDQTMEGAYNAAAPGSVTHREFIHVLAKVINKPVLPFRVPGFLVRTILGEMSDVILKGSRVSSERIKTAGYRFLFTNLGYALKDVIER